MNLYVRLLAFRAWKRNITIIGYEKIMAYTGMRRANIPRAASLLVAADLIRVTDDLDALPDARSKRYRIAGLRTP